MKADEGAAAKQVVSEFWEVVLRDQDPRQALTRHASPDLRLQAFHPVNELQGPGAVVRDFGAPLRTAFPDLLRRPYICIAGQHAGATWVASTGDFIGSFVNDWLGICASGHSAYIRFGEFCRVADGRVCEIMLLLDLISLLRQCGRQILPAESGDTRWIPGPCAGDGLRQAGADPAATARSLALVEAMVVGLNDYDGQDLASMSMTRYWTEDMRWYGPAGIGSTRGLAGFEQHHQIPFLHAFPDRVGGTADTVWIAEGPYVACSGFPAMYMHHRGDYLGHPATNRHITMRDMDWWKRRDDRLVENWVFVDLPDVFLQFDVDLLQRE